VLPLLLVMVVFCLLLLLQVAPFLILVMQQ
jgi:hypothetical protein